MRRNKPYTPNDLILKILVYLLIAILSISAGWSILAVDLNVLPKVETKYSPQFIDGMNHLLTNLSYSYFAGWIIYGITVIYPKLYLKFKYQMVIDGKIEEIGRILQHICLNFGFRLKNPPLTYFKDRVNLEKAMIEQNWNQTSSQPENMGFTIGEAIIYDLEKLNRYISSFISDYKDIIPPNQVVILENIRENHMKSILELGGRKAFELKENAKKIIVSLFFQLIDNYEKL